MRNFSDLYYIDGNDVWKEWGMFFERDGTHPALLNMPARKEEYSRVWLDENGTERYTDNVFFESRNVDLRFVLIADNKTEYLDKYRRFRDYITSKGYVNFDSVSLNMRFKLLYQSMSEYQPLGRITKFGKNQVGAIFQITFVDDFPGTIMAIQGTEYGGYGVEWDTTAATPLMARIGEPSLHLALPVQSLMKRCVLKDDGTVNYYLDPTDSTLKEDGVTPAVLDGTDGMYMVEIPAYYARFETEGTKQRAVISLNPMPAAIRVPKRYVSAVEATVERSPNKLASVVNTTAAYRGGNNNASFDGQDNTFLGRPASALSLNEFRSYARNRGSENWNAYTYPVHLSLFWLYMIEYANMNSQDAFNSNLTPTGYRQGGLGDGVTAVNSDDWNTFNGRYGFVPCGVTNSLGNATGVVDYAVTGFPGTPTVKVPSYRGVENIFGHLWKWTDGINIKIQSEAAGGQSLMYVAKNASDYNGVNYNGYELRGKISRNAGDYTKELVFGENGDMLAKEVGASATTYWCDRAYTNIPEAGTDLRGLLLGGSATAGVSAGVACVSSNSAPATANATIGSRLCFLSEGT